MKEGFQRLLSAFIDTVRRMIAQAAAAKLMQSLFGNDAAAGFFGKILARISAPSRRLGGRRRRWLWDLMAGRRPPPPAVRSWRYGLSGRRAWSGTLCCRAGQGHQAEYRRSRWGYTSITIYQPIDARGARRASDHADPAGTGGQ